MSWSAVAMTVVIVSQRTAFSRLTMTTNTAGSSMLFTRLNSRCAQSIRVVWVEYHKIKCEDISHLDETSQGSRLSG